MRRWQIHVAFVVVLAGCRTQADADAVPRAEAPAAEGTTTAADPQRQPPPVEPSVDAVGKPVEPAAAVREAATFKPVKIPGTPHDEEGVSVTLTWVGAPGNVGLIEAADVRQPSAFLKLERGEQLQYKDTVVLVTQGTPLEPVKDGVALIGALQMSPQTGALTDASRDVPIEKGDEVYMLKYAGEGTCYMQLNHTVYLANCPNDEFGEHERKPQAFQWWVMLEGEKGGVGWLEVDDSVKVETESTM